MNLLCKKLWLTASCGFMLSVQADIPQLPIIQDSNLKSVDLGLLPTVKFIYYVFAGKSTDPSSEYYRISFDLIPTNSAAPLQAVLSRVHFLEEEPIGPENSVYRDEVGGNWLTFSVFDQTRLFAGAEWRYFDVGANAPRNTLYYKARSLVKVYVGFRFPDDDGTHFGWLKFTRSDTTFTNAFDLTAYEWNPIPEAPIRAGLPPEIPVATEVVEDGSGQPVLQVSWNPALATWIFETTTDLTPPVTWTEYPAGGTSAEVPLDGDDTHRYFRLRRPQP